MRFLPSLNTERIDISEVNVLGTDFLEHFQKYEIYRNYDRFTLVVTFASQPVQKLNILETRKPWLIRIFKKIANRIGKKIADLVFRRS